MTRAGFPHSDTPGSTLGWQLPEAYRSLPRPSSASGAKASTTCPYQLDTHAHTTPYKPHTPPPGPPARRATSPRLARTADPATRAPVPSANPTACAPPTPSHHHPPPRHNTQTRTPTPTKQP